MSIRSWSFVVSAIVHMCLALVVLPFAPEGRLDGRLSITSAKGAVSDQVMFKDETYVSHPVLVCTDRANTLALGNVMASRDAYRIAGDAYAAHQGCRLVHSGVTVKEVIMERAISATTRITVAEVENCDSCHDMHEQNLYAIIQTQVLRVWIYSCSHTKCQDA